MAASRKLQAEVEKVLKKVEEGLEEFCNVWDNVHSASHVNQREKFEGELKTQIKKLQRDREQIKAWQSDKNIKDKNALLEARKKIEVEMERFKEFERDAKTKQYSKEGLSKSDKMDPYEEERVKHRSWIQESMDKLHVQIDEIDADVEALRTKKSKNSKQDDSALAHVHHVQETHRWHAKKLDQLLRKLDNDEVDLDELDELRDSVEYYVDENSREPGEFQAFDTIYETFGLEDVDDYLSKDREKREPEVDSGDKDTEVASVSEKSVTEKETRREEEVVKPPSKRANNAAPPSTSQAARLNQRSAKEDGQEPSQQKSWPPSVSVWQNPPSAAPIGKEKQAAAAAAAAAATGVAAGTGAGAGAGTQTGAGTAGATGAATGATAAASTSGASAAAASPGMPPKSVPPVPRPAPTLPPPMQPAPDRPPPPGQAPVMNSPPNQPPPKPAPHQPPQIQPPTQAPPQPPLPSPPAGSPPRPQSPNGNGLAVGTLAGIVSAMPMPPPPSIAPPAPQEQQTATTGAISSSSCQTAPSSQSAAAQPSLIEPPATAPPPPPPPLLPPPPPSPAPSPAAPPSASPPAPQSSSQTQPSSNVDGDPSQCPPLEPSLVEDVGQPAPKVPPPSAAPPPPMESPPPPPPDGSTTSAANDVNDSKPVSQGAAFSTAKAASAQEVPPFDQGGLPVGGLHQVPLGVTGTPPGETSGASMSSETGGPLSPHKLHALQLLEASHFHLPPSSDGRRNRRYVPRNPYVHYDALGNSAYPMQPTRNYEDPGMFEKYDLDTLFFIFYYQQGSYQQHLAAKELKKLSWRYHTKYLTWFQRHEEPRMTASDFERGAYVYFDHDSGWCQRIKSDFTFEYQFLEDDPM